MTEHSLKYTISLCQKLYEDMPPLVPKEIRGNMEKAIDQIQNNLSLTQEEVETTMIFFGKQLWPYREAFEEFYRVYEGTMGEKIFLRKLDVVLKQKYLEYIKQGGSYRNLYTGNNLTFFSSDERVALCTAMVDIENDVEQYARQAVVSTDKTRYEKRIQEFQHILNDIEARMQSLREMAQIEGEHPELKAEIEAQVRAFEQGLCLLAPKTKYHAVCNALEHFQGRKKVITLHKSVLL